MSVSYWARHKVRFGAILLCCCVIAVSGNRAAEKENSPAINLPAQIGERISKCWQAPRTHPPQVIEVTVRLSFTRTGAVIGEPRITYVRAPSHAGLREQIANSVLAAIKACTPLPFTPSLGAAIAGRIFAIRFNSLLLTGRQRLASMAELPSVLP